MSLQILVYAVLGYYIYWVVTGVATAWTDPELKRTKEYMEVITDEEILKTLMVETKEVAKRHIKLFEEGEISFKEFEELRGAYKNKLEEFASEEGRKENINAVRKSVKYKMIGTRIGIFVSQLVTKLLAGVPIVMLLLGVNPSYCIVASGVYMLGFSIASDMVIHHDVDKANENEWEDSDIFWGVALTALISQIPFIILVIWGK